MSRVLLLFGGRSAEHEVSCVSAVAVFGALEEGGHEVVAVGIDRAGGWHLAEASAAGFSAAGPPVVYQVPDGALLGPAGPVEFDVAFPVLHGPYGEDGTIQGMLEMAGVPYVGCGVLPSALAMEKDLAKRVFVDAGLATAQWDAVTRAEFDGDPGGVVRRITARLGPRTFVKPAQLGSSVGISRTASEAELKEGLETAFGFGAKAVVDEEITGREIEVAVLEGPRASLPGEIVIEAPWYHYTAKYEDDTSRFVCPAPLTSSQTAEVRELATRAFTALECTGLARVDFFFEEGGRGFLVNEVNTMPGFTPISGFPAMWQATGMSYAELCNELVRLALDRG